MHTARRVTILIAANLVAWCGPVHGYLYFTNQAPAGSSWFAAENWRESDSPNGSAVPTLAERAYIGTSTGPCAAIVDGPGGVASWLNLGSGTGGRQANLTLPLGSDLYVENWSTVGNYAPAQLMMTGGVFSGCSKLYIGYRARVGEHYEAEVVQHAGKVVISNGYGQVYLNDGYQFAPGYPRYRLVGGRAEAKYWYIGNKGYGKFEMEGGTNYSGNRMYVGYLASGDGEYLQSGGQVKVYSIGIGDPGARGRYELSGGLFNCFQNNIDCGIGGEGTFIQTGGTDTIERGYLNIGGYETGTGLYQISGGKLYAHAGITVGTNGTFKIVGSDSEILCNRYAQHAHGTLDLSLTNGVVSPIPVGWSNLVTIDGTLNITLLGSPDSYPSRSSVVTVITFMNGSGTFDTVNLAPADQLLGVRVNYNANGITLDQWEYPPKATLMIIR